jgi:hypothetical protein
VMAADLDLHFLVKSLQKIQQLVCCEAAEMPVHQDEFWGVRGQPLTGRNLLPINDRMSIA